MEEIRSTCKEYSVTPSPQTASLMTLCKMGWLHRLIPRFLLPSFSWPHRVLGAVPLASKIPPTPQLTFRTFRRFWGFVHFYLRIFSHHYCAWVGIKFDNQIAQLPFGLVLKWSDGTRLEEIQAMQVARAAGFPVPKVICYGEHPTCPHAPVSILMTRLPGGELGQVYEHLSEEDKETALTEMQVMLKVMREWQNPWGAERICSISGTAIRSVRVPNHSIGPCENEQEFNECLLSTASSHSFASQGLYEEKLASARKMHSIHHKIVFTHGDLKHHNILFYKGHVSGFLDWESAGWYPDYWDFTTALRFMPKDFWWYNFISRLGGSDYMEEAECERALTALTVDSYVW